MFFCYIYLVQRARDWAVNTRLGPLCYTKCNFNVLLSHIFSVRCTCMHSADYAVAICLSTCPSVRPSVTRRHYVETAKYITRRLTT